jgi:photosystem II stability/assembly factor-like uncharacterized protein
MNRIIISVIILILIAGSSALADDSYLLVVENLAGDNQSRLEGYPGRAFGKLIDRIYLFGQDNQIAWLNRSGIEFRQIPLNGEPDRFFLCYGVSEDNYDGKIFDSGPNFILTEKRIPDASFCRILKLRVLPFSQPTADFSSDVLEYHATIDSLISEISSDSLYEQLARLSGELPVEVDGEIDTIFTRYSGTEDNDLAARYIYQVLESYGYQIEYHDFLNGDFRNIAIHDENTAWMVDNNGNAYRMTDGSLWEEMEVYVYSELWGVENAGADSLWIIGETGLIRFSDNGGDSWRTQYAQTSNYLFDCCFVDAQRGWIVGDYGIVRRTQNGGTTWLPQTTPVSSRLYDVCFVDSDYGWAVGRDGTIIHTTNGGQDWSLQQSNTNERLYGVHFINSNIGWAVGWSGVVRFTDDGGANWQTVYLGDNIEKYHVDFTDADHGCIAGWGGRIYVTFNGGTVWSPAQTDTHKDLYGLEFANDTLGYAIGNGIILATYDGGLTWSNCNETVDNVWRNVVATKLGTVSPNEQVIICGHFDSRSQNPEVRAPGADDNGSGTLAVLESARLFAENNFEKTIKFCLWTGEEQGLLGSEAYAADASANGDNIIGVFNFDMIAYDGNDDNVGELHCGTMTSSIALGDLMEDVLADYSINIITQFITYGSTDRSDHASFWEFNYPAMLGIEDFDDFNPYYHTIDDNISHIDLIYFTEYTKAALGACATLAIPDTATTGVSDQYLLPEDILVVVNYPNPFNASTVLLFDIPRDAHVRVAVYDILGREVGLLANRIMRAGRHQLAWHADDISSGIYFYRLETAGKAATGRMILLK